MTTRIIISTMLLLLMLSSCTEDETQIDIPETYTFSRNDLTTVSFTGQTIRILMAEEIISAMSDFSKSEDDLLNMFQNTDSPFDQNDLNSSTKSVKSKVAASTDYFSTNTTEAATIKAQFDAWLSAQVNEVSIAENEVAAPNQAGQIADGSSVRYINGKGLEYNQAFAKGLIGGLMVDQILNNYLSPAVLDAGTNVADNDAETLEDGENYTTMEHKWDEAYGYLFGTSGDAMDPVASIGSDDNFLNKYLGRVDGDTDFEGIAEDIFDAFKHGRAAIVEGEYEIRDEQAEIIKELISKVVGVRAVYYLQQGKNALSPEDYGGAFHDLSEGFGFVYSLQFTRQANADEPYVSSAKVEEYITQLQDGNGFWELTSEVLDEISTEIASAFDFTVAEAAE